MDLLEILPKLKNSIDKGRYSSGSYGRYFRIGRFIGVKIIDGYKKYPIKKDFMLSPRYKKTMVEARMLKEASKRTGIVPKFHGVLLFEHKGSWHIGIVQEHICGKSLAIHNNSRPIMERATKALAAFKIRYKDYNPNNFIRQRSDGAIRVIDFTPSWVKMTQPGCY